MITLEILFAVLQGLPAKYFAFLDPPWPPFCQRIENAMKQGEDPLAALQYALNAMNDWGKSILRKLLSQVRPIMALPGLSRRQKEALIVLRASRVASLAQLSRALMQDRSNVHKRLMVLVNKGYAMRFFQPGGIYYYALPDRVDKSLKSSIIELLNKLLDETESGAQPQLPHQPQIPQQPQLP